MRVTLILLWLERVRWDEWMSAVTVQKWICVDGAAWVLSWDVPCWRWSMFTLPLFVDGWLQLFLPPRLPIRLHQARKPRCGETLSSAFAGCSFPPPSAYIGWRSAEACVKRGPQMDVRPSGPSFGLECSVGRESFWPAFLCQTLASDCTFWLHWFFPSRALFKFSCVHICFFFFICLLSQWILITVFPFCGWVPLSLNFSLK